MPTIDPVRLPVPDNMLKVEGIIIDPDPECRARLRQACFAVPVLAKIETSGDLNDVLRRLGVDGDLDYTAIFVSQRFTTEQIAEFIESAKKTERGQDSAFVMVLTTDDQDGQLVTEGLQQGADSFLFEPFSVDTLAKTASLAMEIKKQRQELRERAAVTLLIKDALNNLDTIAERLVRGQEGGAEMKYFRELESQIHNLNSSMRPMYLKLLPKLLTGQPAPLLNLDQEIKSMKSAKMRAHMRLMQKMRERGQDVSLEGVESATASNQKPWDEISAVPGYLTLNFKVDFYDKPTSEALLELVKERSSKEKLNFELELGKTRALSSFAIAKLAEASRIAQQAGGSLKVKALKGFAHDSFTILKLGEFIKVL